MGFLRGLGDLSKVVGGVVQGHAMDRTNKLNAALTMRKQQQDEERDRVLNALTQAQTAKLTAPPVVPPRTLEQMGADRVAGIVPTAQVPTVTRTVPRGTGMPGNEVERGNRPLVNTGKDPDYQPLGTWEGVEYSMKTPAPPPRNIDRLSKEGVAAEIAIDAGKTKNDPPPAGPKDTPPNRMALQLQTQFNGSPAYKDALEIAQRVGQLRSGAANPSAAGDMSILYGLMKALDPGSVVRESEFATAAKSGSLPQRVQGFASKVVNGQRLTPEQRADFMHTIERSAQSQRSSLKGMIDRYTDQAKRHGLNPDDIVYDPYSVIFDADPSRPGVQSPPGGGRGGGGAPQQTITPQEYDALIKAGHDDAEIRAKYKVGGG